MEGSGQAAVVSTTAGGAGQRLAMSDLFSPRFAPQPPSPPPAPPLPPLRYVNRATTALARIAQPFIGVSRPASAQANRAGEGHGKIVPAAIPNFSSPASSQTATHKTGIAISALDISPQRTHAVLAGREILKTIRVCGTDCTEEFNLRGAIVNYASTHNSGFVGQPSRTNSPGVEDVKWSHGSYSTTIATAAANGKIVLYDINRASVELARLHEHDRQVHRLAINPHQGYYLLSGSQDATLRLWDLRAMAGGRGVMSFASSHKYSANADGIRDVRWSPTDGTAFACSTDAGVVQRWDFRENKAPVLKIPAHRKACLSVDWHPDGKHLASAGADKEVRVWDFSSTDRRQNAPWSFRAPQPVTKVRWRPAQWIMDPHGAGTWETAQLVTAYNQQEPRVHVWDLQRPHVPFREMDQYNSAPTDMLWHSGDLLWTVAPDGVFAQTDVYFATDPNQRRNSRPIAVSPDGELTFCAQRRAPSGLGTVSAAVPMASEQSRQTNIGSGERMSGSRSTPEDDGSASLLGTSFRLRHGRSWSARSAGNTPPSETMGLVIRKLDEIMARRNAVRPAQKAFHGYIHECPNGKTFRFLAKNYRVDGRPVADKDAEWTIQFLSESMLHNARVAEYVGFYRTAQTWRILEVSMRQEQRMLKDQKARQVAEKETRAQEEKKKTDDQLASRAAQPDDKEQIAAVDFAFRAAVSDVAEGASRSQEVTSEAATQLAGLALDGQGDAEASGYEKAEGDHRTADGSSAVSDTDVYDGSGASRAAGAGGTPVAIASRTESSAASLHAPPWDRPAASSTWNPSMFGRVSQATLPLRLEDGTAAEQTPRRIARIDSVGSLSMFPSSFEESQHLSTHVTPRGIGGERRPDADRRPAERGSSADTGRAALTTGPTASEGPKESPNRERSGDGNARRTQQGGYDAAGGVYRPGRDSAPLRSVSDPAPQHERDGISRGQAGRIAAPAILSETPEAGTETEEDRALFEGLELPAGRLEDRFGVFSLTLQVLNWYCFRRSDVLTTSALLLLMQQCIPSGAIDEGRIQSTLVSYHGLLVRFEMHVQAAALRKMCCPKYPALYKMGSSDVEIKFTCTACKGAFRPVASGRGDGAIQAWVCERCRKPPPPCPVCQSSRDRGLWSVCYGCGHSGHAICLREWWADPSLERGCPIEGCFHQCTAEPRKSGPVQERRSSVAKERETTTTTRSAVVRGDDWLVGESRAVERLRGGLATTPSGPTSTSSGTRPTGPEKRVKVISPEEEDEAAEAAVAAAPAPAAAGDEAD